MPRVVVQEDPAAAAGHGGRDVVLHDRELPVGDGRPPECLAAAAERRRECRRRRAGSCCTRASSGPRPTSRRTAGGGRRAARRGSGRGRRRSGRGRTCRWASSRRPRGAGPRRRGSRRGRARARATRRPHSVTVSVATVARGARRDHVDALRAGERRGRAQASASRQPEYAACRMAALPPFHASVAPVTAAELGASWRPGCPVGPDAAAHRARLVRRLRRPARTPARSSSTGASTGDVTDGLPPPLCGALPDPPDAAGRALRRQRRPLDGGRQHLRLQLPLRGRAGRQALVGARLRGGDRRQHRREPVPRGRARAAAGRAARSPNRVAYRPGMAVAGGVLVRAFASVGWLWGGRWTGSPDWQHFSKTGG